MKNNNFSLSFGRIVTKSFFLLSITFFLSISGDDLQLIKVNVSNQHLVDSFGRTRIFHGVNAVYKVPPWHPQLEGFDPQLSLSPLDIANLTKWGFNMVRLGMEWPGVEPQKGQYNETYINNMKILVQSLAKGGIYTLLDSHQDVFNRKFCGEGIPDWAVVLDNNTWDFPHPIAPKMAVDPKTGYPSLEDCLKRVFGEYYFSDSVGNAFQNFYNNAQGTQDSYIKFWSRITQEFSSFSSVLGYELINEPWAGDIYADPTIIIPENADRRNLFPLYQKLHTAIRQYDNEHMIFFEKSLSDIVGPTGFKTGPGGKEYNDRQVYSYHIYCAPTDSDGNPSNIIECDLLNEYADFQAMSDLKTLGCGGFLTEFGAMGNSSINSIESIDFLARSADYYFQSWSYWQFKLFQDLTTAGPAESFYLGDQLELNKVKALSRTYAQAIQGVPVSMTFHSDTSLFTLTYELNTSIQAPTIIYLNEEWYYPNGFNIDLVPSNLATYQKARTNYLEITGTQSGTLTVTITAK